MCSTMFEAFSLALEIELEDRIIIRQQQHTENHYRYIHTYLGEGRGERDLTYTDIRFLQSLSKYPPNKPWSKGSTDQNSQLGYLGPSMTPSPIHNTSHKGRPRLGGGNTILCIPALCEIVHPINVMENKIKFGSDIMDHFHGRLFGIFLEKFADI